MERIVGDRMGVAKVMVRASYLQEGSCLGKSCLGASEVAPWIRFWWPDLIT